MSNASHNDPKFADQPEGIMSRATDEGDDTEGHKLRPGITDDGTIPNAPEGYRLVSATDEEDDTEGHLRSFITDDGSTDGPEAMKTRVTEEDDTEGHLFRPL